MRVAAMIGVCVTLIQCFAVEASAQVQLAASVLPNARNGSPGAVLTVFASITNSGLVTAAGCVVNDRSAPMVTSWRTLNANNTPDGTEPNTPFTITAGATRQLLLTFTTTEDQIDQKLDFTCASDRAPSFIGVNTVTITARGDTAQKADVIPVATTPSQDGVVRIPTGGTTYNTNFMAVSAVNIGGPETLVVRPGYAPLPRAPANGSPTLPLSPTILQVCETNSAGQCIALADSLTLNFATNQVRTFGVFVSTDARGGLAFLADINRVFLSFSHADGVPAGVTSAAIVADVPRQADASPAGIYSLWFNRRELELEWPMVAMISPSGRFMAYGGQINSGEGTKLNGVFPEQVIAGNVAFSTGPTPGGYYFASASAFTINGTAPTATPSDTMTALSGFLDQRQSINVQIGQAPTKPGRWGGPNSSARGIPVTDLYMRSLNFSSLAAAGPYKIRAPTDTLTQASGDLAIATSGALSGTYKGCAFTGVLGQPQNVRNLFEMTLVFQTCAAVPEANGKTWQGLVADYSGLAMPWQAPLPNLKTNGLLALVGPIDGGAGALVLTSALPPNR